MIAESGASGWEFLMWMSIVLMFLCLILWHFAGVIEKDEERYKKESDNRLIKEIRNHGRRPDEE